MKYATYGQTATKIAKDGNTLIYSLVPVKQYETDNLVDMLNEYADIVNSMPGKDRLHIETIVKEIDDGTIVLCAEYKTNDDGAKLARVSFD